MRQCCVHNFSSIGYSYEELSCKRPDGHTDRFYSVLAFWVHKKHYFFIPQSTISTSWKTCTASQAPFLDFFFTALLLNRRWITLDSLLRFKILHLSAKGVTTPCRSVVNHNIYIISLVDSIIKYSCQEKQIRCNTRSGSLMFLCSISTTVVFV